MTGLAGLGVVGSWNVDVDETETAWGLTIRSRGFYVQLFIADMRAVRELFAVLARTGDSVLDFAIGDMFGATLLLSIADESMVFRIADRRLSGVSQYPSLFSVSFEEKPDRSDLAAAIKMALEEAECA